MSEACGVPIPDNYPVVGRDAFRTATGVHAAAVVKAWKKGDRELMDMVYSAVPASLVGREQEIDVGPMSGKSNVIFWLEKRGIKPTDVIVDRVFQKAKASPTVLTEEEILAAVYQDSPARASFHEPRAATRRAIASPLLLQQRCFNLRQRREHDIPDDLQALRADVLQRVGGGVPGGVVEIDDVDCGDAGLEKRQVVVFDGRALRQELALVAEAPRRRPDDVGQPAASSSPRGGCSGRCRQSCRAG